MTLKLVFVAQSIKKRKKNDLKWIEIDMEGSGYVNLILKRETVFFGDLSYAI